MRLDGRRTAAVVAIGILGFLTDTVVSQYDCVLDNADEMTEDEKLDRLHAVNELRYSEEGEDVAVMRKAGYVIKTLKSSNERGGQPGFSLGITDEQLQEELAQDHKEFPEEEDENPFASSAAFSDDDDNDDGDDSDVTGVTGASNATGVSGASDATDGSGASDASGASDDSEASDEDDESGGASRRLAGHTKHFVTNSCGEVSLDACETFSSFHSRVKSDTKMPEIGCDECVIMDITDGKTVSLDYGLNIIGKLYFPNTANVVINTKAIIVQGILEVEPPKAGSEAAIIPNPSQQVKIILSGEDTVTFFPYGLNELFCGKDEKTGDTLPCSAGKKPIFVAGGQLKIQAMDETCPSFARLAKVSTFSKEEDDKLIFDPIQPRSPSCDPSGAVFQNGDFETDYDNNWSCRMGCSSGLFAESLEQNSYFSTSDRWIAESGPTRFLTPSEVNCIVPNQKYILSGRFRLTPESSRYRTLCSTSGNLCPKVRIIYDNTKDDSNPVSKSRLIGKVDTGYNEIVNDGEWTEFTLLVQFKPEEVTDVNFLEIVLHGVEKNVDIDVDDISLRLPSKESTPGVVKGCDSLVPADGTAQTLNNGISPYPFKASGTFGAFVHVQDDLYDPDMTNKVFALKGRSNSWSGFEFNITSTGCLVANEAYIIDLKYRIYRKTSLKPAKVEIAWPVEGSDTEVLADVGDCPRPPAWDGSGAWKPCSLKFTAPEEMTKAPWATVRISVYADINSDIDFDDISIVHEFGGNNAQKTIEVTEPEAARCWGPGAQLVITSDTLDPDHFQVVTIDSTDKESGVITLKDPLRYIPTTVEQDANYAVEVGLLNRNFIVEGVSDESDDMIGGHTMIFHTPKIIQNLQGVEFRNMGQAGELGRYPIHFHMCENATDSTVSRNVIRKSNQRCVVLHGTHEVLVEHNMAFDNFGHCYMVEDGGEYDNSFEYNLGAVVKAMPGDRQLSKEDTDTKPSVFWITNPMNNLIGNIAAGSPRHGFWYEVALNVRGPSKSLRINLGKRPKNLDMGIFRDNIAHSNGEHGLNMYRFGYNPQTQAVFENFKSYRNAQSGIFLHGAHNIKVLGGHISDSRDCVRTLRANDIVVDGLKCTMLSDDYRDKVLERKLQFWSVCSSIYSDEKHMAGVTFTPTQWEFTGLEIKNSVFENYHNHSICTGFAVEAERGFVDRELMMASIQVSNVSFTGGDLGRYSVCRAEYQSFRDYNVRNMAIEDFDGSLSGSGKPGFLVQDSFEMTGLIPVPCEWVPESCMVHCPGVCLRNLLVRVPCSPDLEDVIMHITDEEGRSTEVERKYAGEGDSTKEDAIYGLYVPPGKLEISFKDYHGNQVWPAYIKAAFEESPKCEHSSTLDDLTFVERPPESTGCNNIIINGDFESGVHHSWFQDGSVMEMLTPGADGSKYGVKTTCRHSKSFAVGVWQFLDTSCLTDVAFEEYEISGKLRLIQNSTGQDVECDLNENSPSSRTSCPCLDIAAESWSPTTLRMGDMSSLILPKIKTTSDESWTAFNFEFTFPPDFATKEVVRLRVTGNQGMEYYLDDFKLSKVAPSTTKFVHFSGAGIYEPTGAQKTEFDKNRGNISALLASSPNKIIRRRCSTCRHTHKTIYYRRLTPHDSIDLPLLLETSFVDTNNVLGTDFEMYSTYEDAVARKNGWKACGFSTNRGFPGKCGPTELVDYQQNWYGSTKGIIKKNVLFSVEVSA